MSKISLEITSGTINCRKASAKTHLFFSPTDGSKECFMSEACRLKHKDKVCEVSKPNYTNSLTGVKKEIGGQMVRASYSVEQGSVLKLFVNIRRGYGKQPIIGSIFLLVDSKAPLKELEIDMLDSPMVEITKTTLTGRFTVISGEQASLIGCKVPKPYLLANTIEKANKLITSQKILAEGIEQDLQIKKVEAEDGSKVEFLSKKRKRSIG